ncbi:MAG: hypothetical protein WD850_02025 [Candidatus Spechtbacterales bacterium]
MVATLGIVANVAIRLGIIYFLGEVWLFPDDPRFAGKAIPLRNTIIVLSFSLLFPLLYWWRKKWPRYPWWLDNLYLSIFLLDMAGNSFNLYDRLFYFDLIPHFHGTGAIAAVLFGAFGFGPLLAVGVAHIIHTVLEAQEYYTDVLFGTHNVRGTFDVVNDLLMGLLGAGLYVGLYLWLRRGRPVTKRWVLAAVIAALSFLLVLGIIFRGPLGTHAKTILFVTQEFPSPVKPLTWVSDEPRHEQVIFDSDNGPVVGDLFIPAANEERYPAVIITLGVRMGDENYPVLLHFAETLSRLGYVALWPRLETVERRQEHFERPETFVAAYQYLQHGAPVAVERTSFVGFSVGSSLGFVAASDSAIADDVHGLVFFGGYYDLIEYTTAVATRSATYQGRATPWEPSEETADTMPRAIVALGAEPLVPIFETNDRARIAKIIAAAPQQQRDALAAMSPAGHVDAFGARLFILHDESDSFVPYQESLKLYDSMRERTEATLLITNLFEHVQVQSVSFGTLGEMKRVYGFLYHILRFL